MGTKGESSVSTIVTAPAKHRPGLGKERTTDCKALAASPASIRNSSVSLRASTGTATAANVSDPQPHAAPSKDSAIQELLDIVAANNIPVSDRLLRSITGKKPVGCNGEKLEQTQTPAPPPAAGDRRMNVLGALFKEHQESLLNKASMPDDTEAAVAREARDKLNLLKCTEGVKFEIRIKDGSYAVHTGARKEAEEAARTQHIATVTNSGGCYQCLEAMRRLFTTGSVQRETERKVIMEKVNLLLEEGKMYLILGAPGCGKSVLLKMIANLLPRDKNNEVGGTVTVNGVESTDKNIVWSNIVSYVNQIERLHGYLTARETIKFAFECSYGTTHSGPYTDIDDSSTAAVIKEMDAEDWLVNAVLRAVGIDHVGDTFVGNNKVRGVSGGEKKRVSVAETMAMRTYVQCFDEISTGLDAAITYDIVKITRDVARMRNLVRVVSLLQPPPETVALFDEVILLNEGRVLYKGPVDEVTGYFRSLGYRQPERMDPADWLQSLPTKDGAKYLIDDNATHLTTEQFMQKYSESERGQEMLRQLQSEASSGSSLKYDAFKKRYTNGPWRSIKIVFRREFLLWRRDKYARVARLVQDVIMGLIVGTVFWQNEDPGTFIGVVFQCVFFVTLGAMIKIPPQIDTRCIFYKEQDANLYPTWTFVLGRALAGIPSALQDALIYGSCIYWMAGFAPNAGAYFMFLLLILLVAFTTGVMFSVFSATIKDRPTAQACISLTMVVLVLFSGFTVQPDIIPPYYIWIYWSNIFAWIIRAIIVNEYQSGYYDDVVDPHSGTTEAEAVMERFGFSFKGKVLDLAWTWYTIIFVVGINIVSLIASVYCLNRVRFVTGGPLSGNETDANDEANESNSMTSSQSEMLEVTGATITFKNVNYLVKASTTKDKLHLLKGINGYFEKGKLTALMGSSGAGKTTLMDVLSLRKRSGEITGDIYVNGFPQDPDSFRRMSGYVEQFDTQSPQLTVRETVEFSALMRLDQAIPMATKQQFIDKVLRMLELDLIAGLQVGSDSTGGLSCEQKKRLSIAVELASNPSCIFLDEPTSGLDARAASIVMRSLKRIADSGIGVVATIHQPSVAIFNSFDSLLLLKQGGETIFFGELGHESCNLINYLEAYSATAPIKNGENPASWMLSIIGAGSLGDVDSFDYAKAYTCSQLASDCVATIDSLTRDPAAEGRIVYPTKYATNWMFQSINVYKRLSKIYWRSPGYNRVRLLVSGVVALLFGSVYASQRVPANESDMNSRITSIYVTALFLGVNAMNTVLPVFEMERNMFYSHNARLMYNHRAINLSFLLVEIPFIVLASFVFTALWYFTVGFDPDVGKFFLYWLFTAFSVGTFTQFGQAFMAIFRDTQTAQGFGSLLIGMNSIFGGVLIRPQFFPTFWIWAYWVFPLHYILEGLFTSQFNNDATPITPFFGSPYYKYVRETYCPDIPAGTELPADCNGTAEDWIYVAFGGMWVPDHIPYCIIYLIGANLLAKAITLYGLKQKIYLAT